ALVVRGRPVAEVGVLEGASHDRGERDATDDGSTRLAQGDDEDVGAALLPLAVVTSDGARELREGRRGLPERRCGAPGAQMLGVVANEGAQLGDVGGPGGAEDQATAHE